MSGLLDPETYRLWLGELELASVDVPEFRSWISSRNLAAAAAAAPPRPFSPDQPEDRPPPASDEENYNQRLGHDDSPDARRTFPGSIGGREKNLVYDEVSDVRARLRSLLCRCVY